MRLNTKTSEESRYNNPNPPKPELPEGCEYSSRRTVCVKKIENKEDYIDLLLDADPSKASIDKYLSDSNVYGVTTSAINQHIKTKYEDNELDESSTIKNFLIV